MCGTGKLLDIGLLYRIAGRAQFAHALPHAANGGRCGYDNSCEERERGANLIERPKRLTEERAASDCGGRRFKGPLCEQA